MSTGSGRADRLSEGARGPAIPLTALQKQLRKITETLANEAARPTLTAPRWSESEWLLARAVATVHGISPLFSGSLPWQGPPGWQRFLDDQRMHTERRHARIRGLLGRLDDAARDAGIALLALKGAALHELQLYRPGERPMADVDLLVREQDVGRAAQMLGRLGFQLSQTSWKHQIFITGQQAVSPFGENAANGMKIELHARIAERLPRRTADITACVSSNMSGHGLNYYPSRAALMLHLLLHAAGAMVTRSVRLIQLTDIARLSASMSSRDWEELLAQERALGEPLWWSYPPLALTARYYNAIPERVVSSPSVRCHWWLELTCRRHTLCDVSLSHLWVEAFPGIEWARSAREMLAYVAARFAPDVQTRALRDKLATTEPAAAESPWAHMSQGHRIVRWLTSRPVRPQAIHPVQTALAQGHDSSAGSSPDTFRPTTR